MNNNVFVYKITCQVEWTIKATAEKSNYLGVSPTLQDFFFTHYNFDKFQIAKLKVCVKPCDPFAHKVYNNMAVIDYDDISYDPSLTPPYWGHSHLKMWRSNRGHTRTFRPRYYLVSGAQATTNTWLDSAMGKGVIHYDLKLWHEPPDIALSYFVTITAWVKFKNIIQL